MSNYDVLLILNYAPGKRTYFCENELREFLAVLRPKLDQATDQSDIVFDVWLLEGPTRFTMGLDQARALADRMETTLLRYAAKGKTIRKTDRFYRDAEKEITEVQTTYEY